MQGLLLQNKKLVICDEDAYTTTPIFIEPDAFYCIFFNYTTPFPLTIDHGMSDIDKCRNNFDTSSNQPRYNAIGVDLVSVQCCMPGG